MLKKKRPAKRDRGPDLSPTAMPVLSVFVTCDGISRDPGTLKPTLYGLFDKITAPSLPGVVGFHVYGRLSGGRGRHKVVVRFIGPNGKPIGPESPPFEFEANPDGSVEVTMTAAGWELKEYGLHKIELLCDGKVLGNCLLVIANAPLRK